MATDLGTGLFSWIKDQASVTALIGEGEDCRFYPVAVQELKTLPYIVYEDQKDSEPATHTESPSVASSRVLFSCIGVTTEDASSLAGILKDLLLAVRNELMGAVFVQGILAEGSNPAYQWEEQQYAADLQVKVWYRLA
jgi:hypothetical protein